MAIAGAFVVPHPPLIIPEVGRGEEKGIENTVKAYKEVARRIAELAPEAIVVTSPHSAVYADYFHISPGRAAEGNFGRFGAGEVTVRAEYDTEFVEALSRRAGDNGFPAGTMGEREAALDHATMIPLYFINKEYMDYRLIRIGLAGLPFLEHYRLGRLIRQTADELGRRTVVVASGDLSHRLKEDGPYGYREEGPEYDRRVMEALSAGRLEKLLDFPEELCDKAGECGHRSFIIMAGALERAQAERLSYEGPFGVGYGVCAYRVPERRKEKMEDIYVNLARCSLEAYAERGEIIGLPEGLPGELTGRRAGAFVSLKKNGRLRGCIGTIGPTRDSLALEIIHNAVSAGVCDPRFHPVTAGELPSLVYSVDVLGETERISSPEELDVKRYGVIVSRGCRRGLLLPNLEGVDTVEEQIAIAREKAGIGEDEEVELERFEVVRHG